MTTTIKFQEGENITEHIWFTWADTGLGAATAVSDFQTVEFEQRFNRFGQQRKFPHTFHATDDDLVEGGEWFWAGANHQDSGESLELDKSKRCRIRILDNDPHVDEARVVSTPPDRVAYRAGETIEVELVFNSPVDIVGEPQVILRFGTDDASGLQKEAGSGSDTLRFSYTVQHPDFDSDGLSIGEGIAGDFAGKVKAILTDIDAHRRSRTHGYAGANACADS